MGRDKARVQLAGQTLLERVLRRLAPMFDDIMVCGREHLGIPGAIADDDAIRFVTDELPGRGPAIGLCAALEAARHPAVVAIACDMPFVSPELIRLLARHAPGHDVVVPMRQGRPEPLCALYRNTCLPWLAARIRQGSRGLVSFIEQTPGMRVYRLSEQEVEAVDPERRTFMDIDTAEALEDAHRLIEAKEEG